MRLSPEIAFSTLALALYALGIALMPQGMALAGAVRWGAVGPGVMLALFALALGWPSGGAVARGIAALWPPAVAMLLVAGGEFRLGMTGGLGLWPFGCAMLAAGLALLPPGRAELPTLALFPLGSAVALALGAGLAMVAPALARLLMATPYHMAIFLTLCVVLVALADGAAAGLGRRRERLVRALIGLLPLLGFLGTVAGIIEALAALPDLFAGGGDGSALTTMLRGLSTAFETTLVGLVGAAGSGLLLTVLADQKGAPGD